MVITGEAMAIAMEIGIDGDIRGSQGWVMETRMYGDTRRSRVRLWKRECMVILDEAGLGCSISHNRSRNTLHTAMMHYEARGGLFNFAQPLTPCTCTRMRARIKSHSDNTPTHVMCDLKIVLSARREP